jgi:hypothetical protein
MQPSTPPNIDALLWHLLGDELDAVLPPPPRVPAFAAETVRPEKAGQS